MVERHVRLISIICPSFQQLIFLASLYLFFFLIICPAFAVSFFAVCCLVPVLAIYLLFFAFIFSLLCLGGCFHLLSYIIRDILSLYGTYLLFLSIHRAFLCMYDYIL